MQNLADGNTALAADVDKLREENKELQNRVSSVFQQVQALQLQASELTQERDRAQENEALMRFARCSSAFLASALPPAALLWRLCANGYRAHKPIGVIATAGLCVAGLVRAQASREKP